MDPSYKLINMPLTLSREVEKRDPSNPDKWVRDDQWYIDTENAYELFLVFFQEKNLFVDSDKVLANGVRRALVTRGDLTDTGFIFYQFASDKWLNYFDKNKNKPAFNAKKKLGYLFEKFQRGKLGL